MRSLLLRKSITFNGILRKPVVGTKCIPPNRNKTVFFLSSSNNLLKQDYCGEEKAKFKDFAKIFFLTFGSVTGFFYLILWLDRNDYVPGYISVGSFLIAVFSLLVTAEYFS